MAVNRQSDLRLTRESRWHMVLHKDAIAPEGRFGTMSFVTYLHDHRNEILAGVIAFFLATVLIGTVLTVGQEGLKRYFFPDTTKAQVLPVGSALGVFQGAGPDLEITQILSYDISATDLVKGVKITAVFGKTTEVSKCYVQYSVDIQGFKIDHTDKNVVTVNLNQQLDVSRKATVYFLTRRMASGRENIRLDLPEIHVEGTDKNGKTVYR